MEVRPVIHATLIPFPIPILVIHMIDCVAIVRPCTTNINFIKMIKCLSCVAIILDLTVVLNFAIDGVWINSLDDFGERFREKSVSQLL